MAVLLQGIVSVGAGVVTFTWPGMTGAGPAPLHRRLGLLSGIFQVVVALAPRKQLEGDWLVILSGLLSIAFGIWMVAAPGEGALAVAGLIGSYAIMLGVLLIVAGLQLRGLSQRLDKLAGPQQA